MSKSNNTIEILPTETLLKSTTRYPVRQSRIETTNLNFLTDFNGHKYLLVAFGGLQQGLEIPVFEFFNSISDIPCDKVFLRDFNQAWYHKGVDDELDHSDKVTYYLKKIISENKYDKVCFLGNCMGGYAAILFGSILNVDCVISFVPQSFLTKRHRLLYADKRVPTQIHEIYTFKEKRMEYFDLKKFLNENQSYKTQLNIYYSPKERLDRKHAERLKNTRNVTLHPIQEGGHGVIKTIRDNGQLKKLIKSTFNLL